MKTTLFALFATVAVAAVISTSAQAQPAMFQKSELKVGTPVLESKVAETELQILPPPPEDLKKKADAGDAVAMRDIGTFYREGEGKNWTVAHDWFLKAAKKGDVEAQYLAGRNYWGSGGVVHDAKAAQSWLGKAAAAGHVKAQALLGRIMQEGEEGKKTVTVVAADPKRAFKLFKQAAEKEDADAEYGLGHAYMSGEGTAADVKTGLSWLEKAASHGHMVAQRQLAQLYYSGDGGVAADNAKAVTYFEQAAAQGDTISQYFLGRFYEKGLGVEKDGAKAAEWFRKVDQDEMLMDEDQQTLVDMLMGAQLRLGVLHRDGFGVKKDAAEAARWFTRAARLGSPAAQIYLGAAYESGAGVAKDKIEAYRWYGVAASNLGSPFPPDNTEEIAAKEAQDAIDLIEKSMTPEEITAGKQAAEDELRAQMQVSNAYYALSTMTTGGYWRIMPP